MYLKASHFYYHLQYGLVYVNVLKEQDGFIYLFFIANPLQEGLQNIPGLSSFVSSFLSFYRFYISLQHPAWYATCIRSLVIYFLMSILSMSPPLLITHVVSGRQCRHKVTSILTDVKRT